MTDTSSIPETPGAAHVPGIRLRCHCGHGAELHNLTGDRRTACSVSTGPKATPCGCPQFEPEQEASQ